MSGLYSGITFSSKASSESASPAPAASTSNPAAASSSSSNTTAEQREIERQRQAALEDAARYAAQQAELQAKEAAENARKAALGFQPVMRKRPQAGGAGRGRGAAFISAGPSSISSSTIAAPPSLINEVSNNASSSAASGSATISAPPMHLNEAGQNSKASTGRTLLPPPMTLDDAEDVNGFRSTKAGKKASSKKKKRNAGSNRKEEDPSLAWNAEYDPSRPTDYNEYKAYSKRARSERRATLLRERQMEKRKAGMKSEGSDYSDNYDDEDDEDDSDAERRRRIAKANNRFFAPPTNYDDSPPVPGTASVEPEAIPPKQALDDDDDTSMQEDTTNRPSAPPAEDGWAAWSAVPAKVDDPFQRRLALSQQRSSPSAQLPIQQEHLQRQPSPLPTSNISPPGTSFAQPAPPFTNATAPPVPPPSFNPAAGQHFPLPPHMMPPMPPSGSQSPQNSPYTSSAAPTSNAPGPAIAKVAIEEAQARARAIAARLASMGKFGGGAKPSPTNDQNAQASSNMSPLSMPPVPDANEPIPGLGAPTAAAAPSQPKENVKPEDFAKNLMAKYGWTKGQGLGATSQGMVNPLALAGSEQGGSKGKKKEQYVQPQGQPKGGPVGIATAKGRIVSDLKTEKEQLERQKYGEPTRVVCLTNMVGRHDVDDELVADVSEEARKLGVLEKCFVHIQPPYVPEDEAVRVFIVFSGLVGAWKAVNAFEGRYFGGRNVKAKFYNEQALDLGVLHL